MTQLASLPIRGVTISIAASWSLTNEKVTSADQEATRMGKVF
jgi:hypothetical protein